MADPPSPNPLPRPVESLTADTVRQAEHAFAVFGLPLRFELDLADLDRRFAALGRATHPDLAGDDPAAQLDAMDLSAKVNEAYRVLRDDEERANLLLTLLGGPSREADKTLPEGFLPLIMITREELAEAQLEGDADKIAAIEADARAQRAARLREVARLFALASPPDPETLRQIRIELNALRYFERLLEQARPGHDATAL